MRDFVKIMMIDYRKRANKKGREFKLSYLEFRALITSSCVYCGDGPEERNSHRLVCKTEYIQDRDIGNGTYAANGIDRVDSSKGYILSNCVTCCKTCNLMKLTATSDEFLAKIEKIHQHRQKPTL